MPEEPRRTTPLRRNTAAAMARLFATMSLIPLLAIVTGPLAVAFGIAGLRANRKNPTLHAHRSSWIGIGAGALLFAITASFMVRVWTVSWGEYQANLARRRAQPAGEQASHEGHDH